ncbi:FAD-binding protein [Mycolicibacterium grossiae]|uniref:FAD-dependent oxidoreductase 2 FAD-binding domain-containing protein n=1 Tax=Mycolicibacterium grossiae TaxID=1552759 RepID=A0A1E8Q5B2_9MYCO|nr:FAD-binding protein [Mycolicibacterium grossiae]OFJ53441.1 hypothetical protein BEL07_12580 [Mycolicibacterium grossiae]QEM45914.1 hypothetical protein FZ046_15135 [Mycolicibacterium grossiae]
MWDHVVDLVSIGAGIGGLARAIATVDAGADVLVADAASTSPCTVATRRRVATRRGWLCPDVDDPETREYLHGFAQWVPESAYVAADVPVPTRVASHLDANAVEPFVGARLGDWAGQCLTSPYGMLHSTVFGSGRSTMRAADGGTIEVVPIGTMRWQRGLGASALKEWMADQARDRGIEVLTATPLQRLVFDSGRVVGVVLDGPGGPLAVGTRRGVTFAPGERDLAGAGESGVPLRGEDREVCLVGRTASRFGRVELLSPPDTTARALCHVSGRALLAGLRDARSPRADVLRCGKAH